MSRTAIAALAAALVTISAHAQDYPARPVKILVPFAVGGPADIYARYLGGALGQRDPAELEPFKLQVDGAAANAAAMLETLP